MAKPNYSFVKRQKDIAKKQKAEEKKRRKEEAKQAPGQEGTEPAVDQGGEVEAESS